MKTRFPLCESALAPVDSKHLVRGGRGGFSPELAAKHYLTISGCDHA